MGVGRLIPFVLLGCLASCGEDIPLTTKTLLKADAVEVKENSSQIWNFEHEPGDYYQVEARHISGAPVRVHFFDKTMHSCFEEKGVLDRSLCMGAAIPVSDDGSVVIQDSFTTKGFYRSWKVKDFVKTDWQGVTIGRKTELGLGATADSQARTVYVVLAVGEEGDNKRDSAVLDITLKTRSW